ncbi:hypothetical protein D3C81_2207070 [compost metagenome]
MTFILWFELLMQLVFGLSALLCAFALVFGIAVVLTMAVFKVKDVWRNSRD